MHITGVKIVGINDVGFAFVVVDVDADFFVIVGINNAHMGIGYGLLQLLRQLLGEFAFRQFVIGFAKQLGKKSHLTLLRWWKRCCVRKQLD